MIKHSRLVDTQTVNIKSNEQAKECLERVSKTREGQRIARVSRSNSRISRIDSLVGHVILLGLLKSIIL